MTPEDEFIVARATTQNGVLDAKLWECREVQARLRRTHAQVITLVEMAHRALLRGDAVEAQAHLKRARDINDAEWVRPGSR